MLKAHELGRLSDVSELIEVIKSTSNAKQLTRFIPFAFELIANSTINHLFSSLSLKQKKLRIGKREKQFDGFFEDEQSLYFVETKLYRSKITWLQENKKGKTRDYCLKYFFVDKYEFIKEWAEINEKNKKICMCFVTSEGFYKIEEGMKTIDKKISQIYDLPLTVTIEDLIKIARSKNIPTKE